MNHSLSGRLVLFALATLCARPIVFAQPLPVLVAGEAPTRGPEVPTGVIAGEADATQVVLDAANLGFLPAWSLVGFYSYLDTSGVRGPGGGGLYVASPVPYLDALSVGAAVELIRPPDAFPYGNGAKLSLALSYRPLRQLAFGLTYAHVFAGETPFMDAVGIDTVDVSASARLGAWFALALVVHDLNSPQFHGLGLQRVYQPELAIRPLGNDRLEIGLSARIGERRGDVFPAARLFFMPARGVLVRGSFEWHSDESGDGNTVNDFRATAGLELDLAHVGFGLYALFGRGVAGTSAFQGGSVMARISGDRYPNFYTPKRLERVDLGGQSDRELAALLHHLRKLEHDSRVDGILAVMGDVSAGWATTEELRDAMRRLRAAGKHVYAYGADLSMKSYYVAAAAERIFLDPAGGVRFVGLSSTATYFKGSLDLLSVKAEFIKIGEYKSAPEQFTREAPSSEALAVKNAILDDVSQRVQDNLARDRKLDPSRVMALRDRGPVNAAEALKSGLVDELKSGDQVEDAISEQLGHRVSATPESTHKERPRSFDPPAIAALFVEGDIIEGKSRYIPILDQRFAGHETIIHAIEAARGDPRVKAILLRIDSPGGSALASDLIARELARTRQVKPLICSFGDLAASGGYFIAAFCDVIYAEPSTITGSIGIFTGKFDVSGLASRLGVGIDINRRGLHADMDSLFRPYTDEERALILEQLKYYYGRFTGAVAAGRKMNVADVDAVGRGRVWTGRQALQHKLVDKLGGFTEALAEARRRGGLGEWEDVDVIVAPTEPATLLGQIAQLLGINVSGEKAGGGIEELLKPVIGILKMLPGSLLLAPSTVQARLPFYLDVR